MIDAISDPDGERELSNTHDKLEFFFERFRSEYSHEIARRGTVKALDEYLRGLPSTIDFAFYNGDILDLGDKWGLVVKESCPEMTVAESRFCRNWWRMLAIKLEQLNLEFEV